MGNSHRPGRSSTTRGVNSSMARATTSNVRASFASSASRHTASGHRASASRRRIPRVTPAVRASADAQRTISRLPIRSHTMSDRFARSSAPAPPARRRAAITGQSGHQTHPVRLALTRLPVARASPPKRSAPLPLTRLPVARASPPKRSAPLPLIRPGRASRALPFPRRARRARSARADLRTRAPTSSAPARGDEETPLPATVRA